MLVNDALLQRNNSIIGNGDALRTDLGTAFGDVAVTDAVHVFELLGAVLSVERMHLEGGRVNEEPRTDELLMLGVIAKDMTNVLT